MAWSDHVRRLQSVAVSVFREPLADPILFHPVGGSGPFVIEGIYREEGLAVDVNLGAEIRTETPELHVILADVLAITGEAELREGDEITVRGIRRLVAEHDADGEGIEILYLKEGGA